MVQTNIQLPEKVDLILVSLAATQGKKKEDVISDVITEYVDHIPKEKIFTTEEIMEKRRRARGIWKDRTDLPDFDEVRRSMDRKLNWDD